MRKKINGTAERPRLTVYKSNRYIYIQAIDDTAGRTLAAVSNIEEALKDVKSTAKDAGRLGEAVAKKLAEKNIRAVVFDRNGYLYHGVVKAIADGARKAGIQV